MASFEKFKENICEMIDSILDGKVSVHKITKNNGVELEALSVKSKNSSIAPLIYLNDYYNDYNKGRNIESIVDSIVALCNNKPSIEEEVVKNLKEFDKIKIGEYTNEAD